MFQFGPAVRFRFLNGLSTQATMFVNKDNRSAIVIHWQLHDKSSSVEIEALYDTILQLHVKSLFGK